MRRSAQRTSVPLANELKYGSCFDHALLGRDTSAQSPEMMPAIATGSETESRI
jgi:hypothetical protein